MPDSAFDIASILTFHDYSGSLINEEKNTAWDTLLIWNLKKRRLSGTNTVRLTKSGKRRQWECIEEHRMHRRGERMKKATL